MSSDHSAECSVWPLKSCFALEVRGRGVVELADRADQRGRFEDLLAIGGLERRNPAPLALIPARRRQFGVEAEMLSDVVFERDLLEVVEQFLALGEVARPRISRAEREGIGMVWCIDAATGVAVDIPGAAEFGILLDDGVGDAEAAERNAQRDGADAGADDQHMLLRELLAGRRLGPACFSGNETHFLAHQRRIFRRDVFAERRAHHLQHQLIAGVGDDRLRFPVCEQLQHGGADFGLDFGWHTGLRIRNQTDVAPWLVGRFQPALVTGHMDQHHQQHADIALGDRRRQIEFLARQLDIHAGVLMMRSALRASRHRRPRWCLRYIRRLPEG